MKLRIKGNSIRLRLTQSEVKKIEHGQTVGDSVCFSPSRRFYYSVLRSNETKELRVNFEKNILSVLLPESTAHQWCTSDQVSIVTTLDNGEAEGLSVLVEKNFFCLKPRAHKSEDESDMFPNPNLAHGSCGGV